MKMNPEIKERWCNALLSGEYKPGKGVLRRQTEVGDLVYCCWGVLCDLYVKETGQQWDFNEGHHYSSSLLGKGAFPPGEVYRWAGFYYSNADFEPAIEPLTDGSSYEVIQLSHINDYQDEGANVPWDVNNPFPFIVEQIRKNF